VIVRHSFCLSFCRSATDEASNLKFSTQLGLGEKACEKQTDKNWMGSTEYLKDFGTVYFIL